MFNLTVAEAHRYYANGVLVSNCDALRYGLYELVGGGHDRARHAPHEEPADRMQRQDAELDAVLTAPRPPGPAEATRRKHRPRPATGGPTVGGTEF